MQNNQWKSIGDQLPTKSPLEFKDNSSIFTNFASIRLSNLHKWGFWSAWGGIRLCLFPGSSPWWQAERRWQYWTGWLQDLHDAHQTARRLPGALHFHHSASFLRLGGISPHLCTSWAILSASCCTPSDLPSRDTWNHIEYNLPIATLSGDAYCPPAWTLHFQISSKGVAEMKGPNSWSNCQMVCADLSLPFFY